ncbi:MAG: alpha/beta hydrolase [Acidimicrobiia bacterium]
MSITEYARAQQEMLDRYGLAPETDFVDVAAIDGRAHVIMCGDGPPVMMLIGGGVPAAMWAPLMARLDGFTLYAVDLPGHGLSDRAEFTTSTLRPMMTSFLRQVLDGLGLDRPVFVSQSIGGLITTWLALEDPDRVASISYVGCPALMLGTSAPFLLRLASIPPLGRLVRRLQPPSPKQVDLVADMAGEDFSDFPELHHLMLELERLPSFGEDLNQLHYAVVRLRGPRPELEQTPDQLARITQPVQLIWGQDDTFGPPTAGERAARIIPDAEVHVVPGGHAPWLQSTQRVAEILTPFLRKHSADAVREDHR